MTDAARPNRQLTVSWRDPARRYAALFRDIAR